jgi:hypothetical protein
MNNIPAFPRPHSGEKQYAQEGMTLRDYFAAKAMQGMLVNNGGGMPFRDLTEWSYCIADEMMKAREKNDA